MSKLVRLPSSILRKKSQPVKKIDPKVKMLAGEMVAFIQRRRDRASRPVGLAAVQLGKAVRMFAFIVNPAASKDAEDIQVIINPELVYAKGSRLVHEGCLSIPGKTFVLKRAKIVKIRGLNLSGEPRSYRGRDFLAQVFQHELDHLDGVLIDQIGEEGE